MPEWRWIVSAVGGSAALMLPTQLCHHDAGLPRVCNQKLLDPAPARHLPFHWQRRPRVLSNGSALGAWWQRIYTDMYVDETRERGSFDRRYISVAAGGESKQAKGENTATVAAAAQINNDDCLL